MSNLNNLQFIMSQLVNINSIQEEDQKDIDELYENIELFREGKMQEERFKHYRLTRGVYGQRQLGVHMFRLKIPFGRITAAQLAAVADLSDKYATGNLHLTTRQNIQLHYVKLDDAPKVWEGLSSVGLTAREACGNTVRNLTASAKAGIDPEEPFDVSPYVQATFEYFLRNPICQEMGRKIKPAFSSSERDSAFTYFHDFGFIPRVKVENYKEIRGFKVVVAGGLGAVSMIAPTVYEFLPENEIIPFMEAAIRVFDRYGEREKRQKARMKFLVKQLGLEHFLELVELEREALAQKQVEIDRTVIPNPEIPDTSILPFAQAIEPKAYALWIKTNVFEQKQKGYYGVWVKVRLGDLASDTARAFAKIVPEYATDDIRITINQGLLLRFVAPEALPHLYNALVELGLADAGFQSLADVTACPGTDTCNLGVTNSTALANELEQVIYQEYPHLLNNKELSIKISGCMNSCGQHMAASIGFHGSSIKVDKKILPAMQIVLGGGVLADGSPFIAHKVIKLPTRRIPQALRIILDDYEQHAIAQEAFPLYIQRQGKRYFYGILKALADKDSITDQDFVDWGADQEYHQAIGVGECAGVSYDVVATILNDAKIKIELAKQSFLNSALADSTHHSYSAMVIAAKASLLAIDVKCNTHKGIIHDFQKHFVDSGILPFNKQSFEEKVLQYTNNKPTADFAERYFKEAERFVQWAEAYREATQSGNKLVVGEYYNA